MTTRDRLRELLDAVLDEENRTLSEMAGDAFASPYHFSRQLSRGAGEAPVAMRRRVMLDRAAWQLTRGSTVTDAAWEAGYESLEGFSRAFTRAFGHPPRGTSRPAPRPCSTGTRPRPPDGSPPSVTSTGGAPGTTASSTRCATHRRAS